MTHVMQSLIFLVLLVVQVFWVGVDRISAYPARALSMVRNGGRQRIGVSW
jgi:hypothetical protein